MLEIETHAKTTTILKDVTGLAFKLKLVNPNAADPTSFARN
jgi:hypothetical protein